MTLNAGVVRVHVVETGRIEDVVAGRVGHMRFAGAMTFLAADVPLGWGLGGDVEVHGVTAVAQRSGRPLEIVRRVKRRPPIRTVGNKVGPPYPIGDIPLSRVNEIIVTHFLEVTLLPSAAVDERNIVLREGQQRIRL